MFAVKAIDRLEVILCVALEGLCVAAACGFVAIYDPAASGFSWLDMFCTLGLWLWPLPVLHLTKKLLRGLQGGFFCAWIAAYLFKFFLSAISGMFRRPDVWYGPEGNYFPWPGDEFWCEVIYFFWLGIVNGCHSIAIWLIKLIMSKKRESTNP